MTNEDINMWSVALNVIFIIFLFLLSSLLVRNTKNTQDILNECQKNLPRTQHCILIGVPDGN